MSNQIKYDPKAFSNGFFFGVPGNGTQQKLKQEWEEIEEKMRKVNITAQRKNIKWQIFNCYCFVICGIFMLYSTIFKWESGKYYGWFDLSQILLVAFYFCWSVIGYRRAKNRLKELFIDAI